MEEIGNIFKKATNFICIIQQSCNQQRFYNEQRYKEEFGIFLKKQKQLEKEEIQSKLEIEAIKEKVQTLELEEVQLAETLLKKARCIRKKAMVPSAEDTGDIDDVDKNLQNEMQRTEKTEVTSLNKKKIKYKTVVVQQKKRISTKQPTKSQHVNIKHNSNDSSQQKHSAVKQPQKSEKSVKVFKEHADKVLQQKPPYARTNSYKHNKNKQSTNTFPVLKKKNYSVPTNIFKKGSSQSFQKKETARSASAVASNTMKLQSELVSEENDIVGACSSNTVRTNLSDHSDKCQSTEATLNAKKLPLFICFQNDLKSALCSKGHIYVDLNYLWYPFLNSKNEERMLHCITCKNVQELTHLYKVLHNIQETMLWLDLFCLLGKTLIPQLNKLDKSEQAVAVLYSYIQSFFHENFQKTPMITQSETK